MSAGIVSHIWACIDCMLKAENNENPTTERPEPWSRWSDEKWATFTADFDSNTEDGIREFSSWDCGACGSALAGARYRYAQWGEVTK